MAAPDGEKTFSHLMTLNGSEFFSFGGFGNEKVLSYSIEADTWDHDSDLTEQVMANIAKIEEPVLEYTDALTRGFLCFKPSVNFFV